MLAIATHDHKRGEDVRASLAVLSEIPEIWEEECRAWFDINAPFARCDSPGDEYQLYQTLVGAWPIDVERVLAWREKSLREAKLQTSWNPRTRWSKKRMRLSSARFSRTGRVPRAA